MKIAVLTAFLFCITSYTAVMAHPYAEMQGDGVSYSDDVQKSQDENLLERVLQFLNSAEVEEADPSDSPLGMQEYEKQYAEDQVAVSIAAMDSLDSAEIQEGQGVGFKQVYSLDMTDPKQSCPKGLKQSTHAGKRLCGRSVNGNGCNSIVIPVRGQRYGEVHGKIVAYQYASPDAFNTGQTNIDQVYVDGISVTHDSSPRKHVWTLAASVFPYRNDAATCPGTGFGRPQPAFVGDNYFCSSGNMDASRWAHQFYDIPLWSTMLGNCVECKGEYKVPYFCTKLPQPTNDNLEVRICGNQALADEDTLVESIKLYIK